MGFFRKLKANFRLRQGKRSDDVTFTSYDMTEIATTNSESISADVEQRLSEESRSQKLVLCQVHRHRPRPSSASRKKKNSSSSSSSSNEPPIQQVELPPPLIEPCDSSLSASELSDKAKAILAKSFPDIAFDESLLNSNEDLSQYPDPEVSLYVSDDSSFDEEEAKCGKEESDAMFQGLLIDTSVGIKPPSKADEDDEHLVSSPAIKEVITPATPTNASTNNVQPRSKTKNLAHIFHEELSTLYEGKEDESSLTSMSDIEEETEEEEDKTTDDEETEEEEQKEERVSTPTKSETSEETEQKQKQQSISPTEKSIRDRWNHILAMTITGQCVDHRFVLDEAEI